MRQAGIRYRRKPRSRRRGTIRRRESRTTARTSTSPTPRGPERRSTCWGDLARALRPRPLGSSAGGVHGVRRVAHVEARPPRTPRNAIRRDVVRRHAAGLGRGRPLYGGGADDAAAGGGPRDAQPEWWPVGGAGRRAAERRATAGARGRSMDRDAPAAAGGARAGARARVGRGRAEAPRSRGALRGREGAGADRDRGPRRHHTCGNRGGPRAAGPDSMETTSSWTSTRTSTPPKSASCTR